MSMAQESGAAAEAKPQGVDVSPGTAAAIKAADAMDQDEDEEMKLAMAMSVGDGAAAGEAKAEAGGDNAMSGLLQDAGFLSNVLSSLPGAERDYLTTR
eukprot:626659-Rhodomonas_salina.1